MISPAASSRRLLAIWLYCAGQAAFLVYAGYRFWKTGYLPAPFAYDKSDTFMDLFHPLFWSDDAGLYTIWGSVYPPLNFLLLQPLKTLLQANYQFSDAFDLRADAAPFLVWLLLIYLAIPLLVLRTRPWRTFSTGEIVPIYLAIVLASPMLFVLERGNLILLALPFLALALATTGTLCCIAVAVLINIKPYFAILIFTLFLGRRFSEAFTTILAAGAIFLASGIWLDSQFLTFVGNVLNFSQNDALFSARELLSLPSTVSVYGQALRVYYAQGGALDVFGINVELLAAILDALKWIVLCAALATLWISRGLPVPVLLALSIAIVSNLGTWVGGYSIIFYIPLIPVLLGMTQWRFYLGTVLLLLAPLDAVSLLTQNIGEQLSYLTGGPLSVDWDLALGVFVRPPLNLALLTVLSWEVYDKYRPAKATSVLSTPSLAFERRI